MSEHIHDHGECSGEEEHIHVHDHPHHGPGDEKEIHIHVHLHGCGRHHHGHGHHHEHDHEHEHEHEHVHGEECGCGHDHDHEHEHEHVHGRDFDGIHIEHHMHDGACVVSGTVDISAEYAELKPRIGKKLEEIAAAITDMGGIVGHIKASAEVKQAEMFSVTESDVMIKTAPGQDIGLKMACIVFAVTPEQVEPMVEAALKELRG